jgi:NAD(P)-dependent dehydrogenase (short-subunit alcohol dehydrogenase family)
VLEAVGADGVPHVVGGSQVAPDFYNVFVQNRDWIDTDQCEHQLVALATGMIRGVFLGMKHAGPIMTQQGSGSIVSTASVAGLQAGYGPHIYSAAKAAVVHLTRSVAMELGESGVRVNCICPGGIATPIFGEALGVTGAEADRVAETMKVLLTARQPIQRAGLPEDIARAALWLASDDSSFVNGHALIVDGGLIGGRMWSVVQEQRQQLRAALGIGA